MTAEEEAAARKLERKLERKKKKAAAAAAAAAAEAEAAAAAATGTGTGETTESSSHKNQQENSTEENKNLSEKNRKENESEENIQKIEENIQIKNQVMLSESNIKNEESSEKRESSEKDGKKKSVFTKENNTIFIENQNQNQNQIEEDKLKTEIENHQKIKENGITENNNHNSDKKKSIFSSNKKEKEVLIEDEKIGVEEEDKSKRKSEEKDQVRPKSNEEESMENLTKKKKSLFGSNKKEVVIDDTKDGNGEEFKVKTEEKEEEHKIKNEGNVIEPIKKKKSLFGFKRDTKESGVNDEEEFKQSGLENNNHHETNKHEKEESHTAEAVVVVEKKKKSFFGSKKDAIDNNDDESEFKVSNEKEKEKEIIEEKKKKKSIFGSKKEENIEIEEIKKDQGKVISSSSQQESENNNEILKPQALMEKLEEKEIIKEEEKIKDQNKNLNNQIESTESPQVNQQIENRSSPVNLIGEEKQEQPLQQSQSQPQPQPQSQSQWMKNVPKVDFSKAKMPAHEQSPRGAMQLNYFDEAKLIAEEIQRKKEENHVKAQGQEQKEQEQEQQQQVQVHKTEENHVKPVTQENTETKPQPEVKKLNKVQQQIELLKQQQMAQENNAQQAKPEPKPVNKILQQIELFQQTDDTQLKKKPENKFVVPKPKQSIEIKNDGEKALEDLNQTSPMIKSNPKRDSAMGRWSQPTQASSMKTKLAETKNHIGEDGEENEKETMNEVKEIPKRREPAVLGRWSQPTQASNMKTKQQSETKNDIDELGQATEMIKSNPKRESGMGRWSQPTQASMMKTKQQSEIDNEGKNQIGEGDEEENEKETINEIKEIPKRREPAVLGRWSQPTQASNMKTKQSEIKNEGKNVVQEGSNGGSDDDDELNQITQMIKSNPKRESAMGRWSQPTQASSMKTKQAETKNEGKNQIGEGEEEENEKETINEIKEIPKRREPAVLGRWSQPTQASNMKTKQQSETKNEGKNVVQEGSNGGSDDDELDQITQMIKSNPKRESAMGRWSQPTQASIMKTKQAEADNNNITEQTQTNQQNARNSVRTSNLANKLKNIPSETDNLDAPVSHRSNRSVSPSPRATQDRERKQPANLPSYMQDTKSSRMSTKITKKQDNDPLKTNLSSEIINEV